MFRESSVAHPGHVLRRRLSGAMGDRCAPVVGLVGESRVLRCAWGRSGQVRLYPRILSGENDAGPVEDGRLDAVSLSIATGRSSVPSARIRWRGTARLRATAARAGGASGADFMT